MREYKFRAWSRLKKYMFEVNAMSQKAVEEMRDGMSFRYARAEVVLMQSTGLYDKNGVEIHEGDILGDTDGHYCYVSWHEEEGFWATGDYVGSNHWDFLEDTVKMSDFRVIGNIYDNPELLK